MRYDNAIFSRFLANIDCFKIPAQGRESLRGMTTKKWERKGVEVKVILKCTVSFITAKWNKRGLNSCR